LILLLSSRDAAEELIKVNEFERAIFPLDEDGNEPSTGTFANPRGIFLLPTCTCSDEVVVKAPTTAANADDATRYGIKFITNRISN